MTREEARTALSDRNNLLWGMSKEEKKYYSEALDMAISALAENKGDLISRQAVLNGIAEWIADGYADSVADCSHISSLVSHLPSVENKGEWIKYGVPRCGEQHYKCTSCGYYINFGQWGELYTKEFKFCPNCGADMRGKNNG